MPLSEHEQRLLEQMERALYAEDPKFATSMRNPRSVAADKRRAAVGVVGFLVGMGLLLVGVASHLVIVGVVGFLAMLGGIWLAVVALRPAPPGTNPATGTAAPRSPRSPRSSRPRGQRSSGGESLSQRMEERWRRRRETGDF